MNRVLGASIRGLGFLIRNSDTLTPLLPKLRWRAVFMGQPLLIILLSQPFFRGGGAGIFRGREFFGSSFGFLLIHNR
jgi:hypothetical protein